MANGPLDVGRILDEGRWGGYQRWIAFLTALTIIFDGIDNQLLGIVIPTIMREWSLPRTAFAPIVSLGFLGMMLGGWAGGLVGDRLGRKGALLGSMLLFGATTSCAALVHDPASLGWLRLLAGLGLGGAMPNAATLAAEYVPLRLRPVTVTVTILCVPLGATLAGLLGIRALPLLGWRMLFVIGGLVPVVAAVVLFVLLPESPRFLARHPSRWPELVALLRRMGHRVSPDARFIDTSERQVQRLSIRTLLGPELRFDTLALCGAFFSCLLAIYLGFSWLTSLLTGAGISAGTANTGITAWNLGGVVGALGGGFAIARFGSRPSMLAMAAGGVIGAAILATMTISGAASVVPIILMLGLTGGFINAAATTMYALAAHVYPSAIRATGVGMAVAFGRAGSIVSGYAGAGTLEWGGSHAFFGFMTASMCVTFVSLALVKRHVPGRS